MSADIRPNAADAELAQRLIALGCNTTPLSSGLNTAHAAQLLASYRAEVEKGLLSAVGIRQALPEMPHCFGVMRELVQMAVPALGTANAAVTVNECKQIVNYVDKLLARIVQLEVALAKERQGVNG